eukprot:Rmarinus@m.25146
MANIDAKTLYVADLEPYWDEIWLKQTFQASGDFESCKIIRDKQTGHSLGYGFVDFRTHEAAKKVLELWNGSPVPGASNKVFKLNWASQSGSGASAGEEYSLYVGDLAPEVTDQMLLETYSSKGFTRVKSAKVVTDPVTGATKGFGFVRFFSGEERDRAVQEMQGVLCGSKPMRVALATAKRSGLGAPGGERVPVGSAPQVDLYAHYFNYYLSYYQTYYGMDASAAYSAAAAAASNAAGGAGAASASAVMFPQEEPIPPPDLTCDDPTNTTLLVTYLDPLVADNDLQSLFAYYGTVVSVRIATNRSSAYVQFSTHSEAESAITSLHGWQLGNMRIRLAWSSSSTDPNIYGSWNGAVKHPQSQTQQTATVSAPEVIHPQQTTTSEWTEPREQDSKKPVIGSGLYVPPPRVERESISGNFDTAAMNLVYIEGTVWTGMDPLGMMMRMREELSCPDGPA